MTDPGDAVRRLPVVLAPGEGRAYPMGSIAAIFKADAGETAHQYSISEWWLEPYSKGPGRHEHPEDNVFYVLAGTMSVLVGTEWIDASTGTFILIPSNVAHDFENRASERAGMLAFVAPGDFEEEMPGIAEWFAENPPGDTRA